MMPAGTVIKVWVAVMVALIVLLLTVHFVHAHDHEHPELDGWYSSLKSKGGHPCCDGSDFSSGSAHHLTDIDWESKDGHYRVRIDGQWYDVPEDSVIEGPNRDGRAIVWGYPTTEYGQNGDSKNTGYYVRCFIPGTMT